MLFSIFKTWSRRTRYPGDHFYKMSAWRNRLRSNITEPTLALPRADSVASADDNAPNFTRGFFSTDQQLPVSVTQVSTTSVTQKKDYTFSWKVFIFFMITALVTNQVEMWKIDYITNKMTMEQKVHGHSKFDTNESLSKIKGKLYWNNLIRWVAIGLLSVTLPWFHKQTGTFAISMFLYLYTCYCFWGMQREADRFVKHTEINCYRSLYGEEFAKGVNGIINSIAYKW